MQQLYGLASALQAGLWPGAARQEQYYEEAAGCPSPGARDIPQTPRQIAGYLQDMRPVLRCDERTQRKLPVLLSICLPGQ